MNTHFLVYAVFGIAVIAALIFDLGLLNKKSKTITIKAALYQTLLWVSLALCFFVFLIFEGKNLNLENGKSIASSQLAIEFLSAYLMEWSLSVDNIFVFILIFKSFNVKEKYHGRVLLIGILMAIFLRVLFILVGVGLVHQFHFILYGFGLFLIYTGYKMFFTNEDEVFNPEESKVYKWLQKLVPLTTEESDGKYMKRINGKPVYTSLFVVVVMLAFTDILFALDSIPAVMGISNDFLIICTSNIFAILGLRSLFFLIKGAANKFDYLQQGIAIILVFIGLKMLLDSFLEKYFDKQQLNIFSLIMILVCIVSSMIYSRYHDKKVS